MPTKAAVVALTPMAVPKTHSSRSSTNVAAMMISPRVMDPIFCSSLRAMVGASGVLLSVGG